MLVSWGCCCMSVSIKDWIYWSVYSHRRRSFLYNGTNQLSLFDTIFENSHL